MLTSCKQRYSKQIHLHIPIRCSLLYICNQILPSNKDYKSSLNCSLMLFIPTSSLPACQLPSIVCSSMVQFCHSSSEPALLLRCAPNWSSDISICISTLTLTIPSHIQWKISCRCQALSCVFLPHI